VNQGIAPNPGRLAAGWEARFVADRARAREAIELYRELGFEVVADPVAPQDLRGACEPCRIAMQLQFSMIYTRRPAEAPAAARMDELGSRSP
jgi:hypothetical protein